MTAPPPAGPDMFGVHLPFAELCGIEAVGLQDGCTRLRVHLAPQHGNHLGMAHGGLLATLLDVAMGTAARHAAGCSVVTLDMQVSFIAAGHGTLLAEGRVLRAGRSIVFAEADIRDAAGELVAKASGVFKPVPQRTEAPR